MKDYRYPALAVVAAAILVVGVAYFRSSAPAGMTRESGGVLIPDAPTESASRSSAATRNSGDFRVTPLGRRAYAINQSFDPPPGDATEVVSRLLPAAQAGDEVAAFNIYLKIAACRNELDQARKDAPNTAPESLIPPECQSVPSERYAEYMRWLEASAERGYVPAQLLYAVDSKAIVGGAPQMLSNPEAVSAYRNKAMRYLNQAMATGNVDALRGLASAYGNGVLTKRDPVKSYAYFLASETAQPANLPAEITQMARERFEQDMTPQEINRATTQGRNIYKECCSR